MKTLTFNILLIFFLSFLGCGPSVRFEEPQPSGKRNLSSIPRVYRGFYQSLDDCTTLRINSDLIIHEFEIKALLSKEQMQEEFDTLFTKDTRILYSENSIGEFKIIGDSTKVLISFRDTLFSRSEKELLRQFKGYLFLNYQISEDSWKVKYIRLECGLLDIDDLLSVSELDTLRELVNIDTVRNISTKKIEHYRLQPSRKDIKEILKTKNSIKKFKKI